MAAAVDDCVARQVVAGVDIVSYGETSKISSATYIEDRFTGVDGDSPRRTPGDLLDYPGFIKRLSSSDGTPSYRRPCCVNPIGVMSLEPLTKDTAHASAAEAEHAVGAVFMKSASGTVLGAIGVAEACGEARGSGWSRNPWMR